MLMLSVKMYFCITIGPRSTSQGPQSAVHTTDHNEVIHVDGPALSDFRSATVRLYLL